MKAKYRRTMEAAERGQAYLNANPNIELTPIHRAQFDARLARMQAFDLEQMTHKAIVRGSKDHLEALRQNIWDQFIALPKLAAEIELKGAQDFPAFQMPYRVKEGEFVTMATVFKNAAANHMDVFAPYVGEPKSFLARFEEALAGLTNAMDTRGQSEGRKQGARGGIEETEKQVRLWLKILDGNISKQLSQSDPATLAGWRAASKIHKLPVNPLPGGEAEWPEEDKGDTKAS